LSSDQTSLAKGLILHLLGGNDDVVARGALEEVRSLFREGNYSRHLRERAADLSKRLGYLNPDIPMVNGFTNIIKHCGRLGDWNDVSEIWTSYLDLLDEYEECDEQKRISKADELETNGKFKLGRTNSEKTDKYGTLYLSDEDDDEADDDDIYSRLYGVPEEFLLTRHRKRKPPSPPVNHGSTMSSKALRPFKVPCCWHSLILHFPCLHPAPS